MNIDTNKIRETLDVLLHPSCWSQLNPFNAEWDRRLTWLLDNGYRFSSHEYLDARVYLGDYKIWIKNHPYASFHPIGIDVRPRRATILRAHRIYLNDILPPFSAHTTPTNAVARLNG